MVSQQLQEVIKADQEKDRKIAELEKTVRSMQTALSGVDSESPDLQAVFDAIPIDRLPDSVTLGQIQEGWRRGWLLNVSEAAMAAGRAVSRISAAYQNAGSELPSIQFAPGEVSRTNRTTFIYIGWIADKWRNGPGAVAWRAGRDVYSEWVKANLDRPDH